MSDGKILWYYITGKCSQLHSSHQRKECSANKQPLSLAASTHPSLEYKFVFLFSNRMCHAPNHRIDPSSCSSRFLVAAPSQTVQRVPRSTPLHEERWIEDDERLEMQCIGDDRNNLWIETSPRSFSSSNRLVMVMLFAAAALRVRFK